MGLEDGPSDGDFDGEAVVGDWLGLPVGSGVGGHVGACNGESVTGMNSFTLFSMYSNPEVFPMLSI